MNAPLSEVGGKGLFIKELEQAMLDGRADAAVHSMKDVPAVLPEGFVLTAIGYREDVRDVLVGVSGGLDGLAHGARVGSSSLRRRSQLLAARPDLDIQPIRGNVDTRLAKLDAGEFDAIVLAAAGLNRLEIEPAHLSYLPESLSLPAAGQAALGVECLAGAGEVIELLSVLNDDGVAAAVRAERGVSEGLGADCSMPLAALAETHADGTVALRARLCTADGGRILSAEARDADPQRAASAVVDGLREQGAEDILDALR